MENRSKIHLGIVDDDRLLVQLLRPLLQNSGNILVTLIAHSGNDFFRKLENGAATPDIILLDLRMDDGNGLDVMYQLQKKIWPIKIIVLSSHYKISFIGQMLRFGAHAFLPKQIDKTDLLTTIEEVCQKGHCLSPEQMEAVRQQLSAKTPKFHIHQNKNLTVREVEVLQLLCLQMSTMEIANQLFISPKTVESHKSNLIIKAGVRNMAGLVIFAAQNRIIDPDELLLLDR